MAASSSFWSARTDGTATSASRTGNKHNLFISGLQGWLRSRRTAALVIISDGRESIQQGCALTTSSFIVIGATQLLAPNSRLIPKGFDENSPAFQGRDL